MEKPYVLHMFTPGEHVSPFDVNMALDAGFDTVMPYVGVTQDLVARLTQDAIFSRGPKGVRRTGIFIGGRALEAAKAMLAVARSSMVPPFEVSVFADPSGAYTTAAAMVAAAQHHLQKQFALSLAGRKVLVLSGTGPVGLVVATLAAQAGAEVTITSQRGLDAARSAAELANHLYGVQLNASAGGADGGFTEKLQQAEVVLATPAAGVCVLSRAQLGQAARLLVAADINAVPPQGIEGLGVMDAGQPLVSASGKAVGIGALSIGNIKYQVQQGLFKQMLQAEKAVYLDFKDAYRLALEYAA